MVGAAGVDGTLAAQGASLFRQFGCGGCHGNGSTVRAPALAGLYGKRVPLSDGTMEVADERYIRDSILKPRTQIAAGYEPLMPSYEGKLSEDEIVKIVAYIKSLGGDTERRDERGTQLPDRRQQSALVAFHHRPQARRDALFRRHHIVFLHRRRGRDADPARTCRRRRAISSPPTPTTGCSPSMAS